MLHAELRRALGETAVELGVDMKKLALRVAFLGAEPWTEHAAGNRSVAWHRRSGYLRSE